jgi:hypothetical protein
MGKLEGQKKTVEIRSIRGERLELQAYTLRHNVRVHDLRQDKHVDQTFMGLRLMHALVRTSSQVSQGSIH